MSPILFTGAGSFTGYWFVKELVRAGYSVIAPLKRHFSEYEGVRLERLNQLKPICQLIENCPFGSDSFISLLHSQPAWSLICHHAADVTNYKSPDFNPISALANNTHNLRNILQALKQKGAPPLLLTGSVFEQGEGRGSDGLPAVSPYGLSKGLTWDYFKYYCAVEGIPLAKFVIPNPFGPYEEQRYTAYLMKTWMDGRAAEVKSPSYERDNIPVTLLAKVYAFFVSQIIDTKQVMKFSPSYYTESQGAFTERFAVEMRKRLEIPCEYNLHEQVEFIEPRSRFNTDRINPSELDWSESAAWDELAEYYQKSYNSTVCV